MFIINNEGKFITNLDHPQEKFCKVSCYENTLYVGTETGRVLIYPSSSMVQRGVLEFPMSLK